MDPVQDHGGELVQREEQAVFWGWAEKNKVSINKSTKHYKWQSMLKHWFSI